MPLNDELIGLQFKDKDARRPRIVEVAKVSGTFARIKNISTGRATGISIHRLTDRSRFEEVGRNGDLAI